MFLVHFSTNGLTYYNEQNLKEVLVSKFVGRPYSFDVLWSAHKRPSFCLLFYPKDNQMYSTQSGCKIVSTKTLPVA